MLAAALLLVGLVTVCLVGGMVVLALEVFLVHAPVKLCVVDIGLRAVWVVVRLDRVGVALWGRRLHLLARLVAIVDLALHGALLIFLAAIFLLGASYWVRLCGMAALGVVRAVIVVLLVGLLRVGCVVLAL